MKYSANSLLVADTLDQSVSFRTDWKMWKGATYSGTNGAISPQSSAQEYHTRVSQNCFASRHDVSKPLMLLGINGHRLNRVANSLERS